MAFLSVFHLLLAFSHVSYTWSGAVRKMVTLLWRSVPVLYGTNGLRKVAIGSVLFLCCLRTAAVAAHTEFTLLPYASRM